MSKEFLTYNNPVFELQRLEAQNTPSVWNSDVRITQYKVTVEEIASTLEQQAKLLKELYEKETNWHNKSAIDVYCENHFGIGYQEFIKNSMPQTEGEACDRLIKIINNLAYPKKIEIAEWFGEFDWIEFEYYKSENYFTWSMARRMSNRIITPMKNSQYILTFKTLEGAKRNFIKQHLTKE